MEQEGGYEEIKGRDEERRRLWLKGTKIKRMEERKSRKGETVVRRERKTGRRKRRVRSC